MPRITKAELVEINSTLSTENEQLKMWNRAMGTTIQEIQAKLNEQGALIKHYERTINVLSGRLLEKDAIISEQNNKKSKEETV
jgi:predicted transcriptional regulator